MIPVSYIVTTILYLFGGLFFYTGTRLIRISIEPPMDAMSGVGLMWGAIMIFIPLFGVAAHMGLIDLTR